MEDHPVTEDASSFGKRKRSPDNLVGTLIPISQYHGQQPRTLDEAPVPSAQTHPLPKRPRLPDKPPVPISNIDLIPSVLWQLIFSYVDPATLSCLVCVNVRFRSLLDSRYNLPHESATMNVGLRLQDTIWKSSRRSFIPTMPKPMADLSEQAQFFLAFGSKCQFCGRRSSRLNPPGSWYGSAVANPVRVIWPFKVRSCTTCLVPRLQKDTDVLLSDASPLRAGLPFALFTQAMLYVPAEIVKSSPIPEGIQITKYHFLSQIDDLSCKAREAQALGAGAAEGWLKGLPQEAHLAQNEAARFEHWEIIGSLSNAYSTMIKGSGRQPGHQYEMPGLNSSAEENPSFLNPTSTRNTMDMFSSLTEMPQMPLHIYGVPPGLEPSYKPQQIYSDATSMDSHKSGRGPKAAPSSREIARNRSRKKHDIVERCRKLNPPILLEMLERLDAFEAALQIPMPLNENAWETLKQRLMQQRQKIVLQDEARNNVTRAPVPGQFRPPSRTDEHVLAHADMPMRQRLCEIAEEYIKQKWGQGGYVTYPSSPHFAADVLIHTRQTYLDHKARIEMLETTNDYMKLTSDDELLTLDHMKWVFEQSIKPRTEQIRKDLFLCRVCTGQGIIKSYAFDSVMQHFASKHTSDFSRGTQVLSWRAKWPDEPPFEAHPERIRSPEPSITHTPTLSNIPLSVTSHGTNTNTIIQSAGWKTPDTMSLLSNTTNTLSVAVQPAQPQQMPGVPTPGNSMFHIQRDALASEIAHGWHIITKTPNIPENLQLYLAINYGVSSFRKRFSNEPSLELFNDCLAKPDLATLRTVENLRCWECIIRQDSNAHANWSLQYLIAHFERLHLERQASNTDRLKWNIDMIALPEPALIKSLLTVGDLPVPMQKQLLDANIAAITKATEGSKLQPSVRSQNLNDKPVEIEHYEPRSDERLHGPFETGASRSVDLLRYQSHADPSLAATWGGLNSSRDILSASSGTLESDAAWRGTETSTHGLGSVPHRQLIELVPSPQGPRTSSGPNSVLDGRDGDPSHTIPEPMSRSTTFRSVRSQRSFGRPPPASSTEDFLSQIESSLEVEMADSGSNIIHESANSRVGSVSASTPGSIARNNRRASPVESLLRGSVARSRNFREHGASPRRTGSQADSPSEYHLATSSIREAAESIPSSSVDMTRGPSRMIEFDNHGTPIQSEGRVHRISSPPQYRYIAQPIDTYSYSSQQTIPNTYPSYREVRATTVQPAAYHEGRGIPQYIYEPIEHDQAIAHHDRIYDPVTRQYYIAERPTVTRYIPIDGSRDRPAVIRYDERGLPIEYLGSDGNSNVNSNRYDDRSSGHDSRHDERFSQGYQRR